MCVGHQCANNHVPSIFLSFFAPGRIASISESDPGESKPDVFFTRHQRYTLTRLGRATNFGSPFRWCTVVEERLPSGGHWSSGGVDPYSNRLGCIYPDD